MKRKTLRNLILFASSACALGLAGCATDAGNTGGGYAAPDPLEQQIKLQEGISRVTRSLTPF